MVFGAKRRMTERPSEPWPKGDHPTEAKWKNDANATALFAVQEHAEYAIHSVDSLPHARYGLWAIWDSCHFGIAEPLTQRFSVAYSP